jgi:hypothetical protein
MKGLEFRTGRTFRGSGAPLAIRDRCFATRVHCFPTGEKKSMPAPTVRTSVPVAAPVAPVDPRVALILNRVRQLLDSGKPEEARRLLAREKLHGIPAQNALGVCLLRVGQTEEAMLLFRGMVLVSGVIIRTDMPTEVKVNFATSLLLRGEVRGCLSVLNESQDLKHPSVLKLRQAVTQWRRSLTFLQRLNWWLGVTPDKPVTLDFPPGELL